MRKQVHKIHKKMDDKIKRKMHRMYKKMEKIHHFHEHFNFDEPKENTDNKEE